MKRLYQMFGCVCFANRSPATLSSNASTFTEVQIETELSIPMENVIILRRFFENNRNLIHVVLKYGCVAAAGLEVLAPALAGASQLMELDLSGSPTTARGYRILSTLLQNPDSS